MKPIVASLPFTVVQRLPSSVLLLEKSGVVRSLGDLENEAEKTVSSLVKICVGNSQSDSSMSLLYSSEVSGSLNKVS